MAISGWFDQDKKRKITHTGSSCPHTPWLYGELAVSQQHHAAEPISNAAALLQQHTLPKLLRGFACKVLRYRRSWWSHFIHQQKPPAFQGLHGTAAGSISTISTVHLGISKRAFRSLAPLFFLMLSSLTALISFFFFVVCVCVYQEKSAFIQIL